MSSLIQFPLILITAFALFAAEPADPPLFQIRLVQDKPEENTETMTITRHIKDQDRIIEDVVYVQKKVLMDHTQIESAALEMHPITGEPQIGITFTKAGANLFTKITRENVNKGLALIVNGRVLSAPIIRTEISGGKAAISGNLSQEETAEHVKRINAAVKAHAIHSLPPLQGELPMNPGAPFQFGPRKHGIRIGLSSESSEYRLNHRINLWKSLETENPFPNGHTLKAGDLLFENSFLFITNPDGTITKVGTGAPVDGPVGVGWRGGCSDLLHRSIRKPGTYKIQWKIGDLESGVISFTVSPE